MLAENVKKLYDKAKPMQLDDLKAEKEEMLLKRREVPADVLEEAERLYAEIPFDQLLRNFDDLAGTDGIAYKRARAYPIIKRAKMPEKLPVYVQAIKIGECMLYGFAGEPFSELFMRRSLTVRLLKLKPVMKW